MSGASSISRPVLVAAAALLCFAATWLYTTRVLIPYQIKDDAAHGRPRGNFSDIYPRWYGTRELFFYGRDPYTIEVTRDIQAGYYGRALDESQAGAQYRQGFYYPLYVAFLFAPTIDMPFDVVRRTFFWVLLVLTAVSVPMWMRVVRWTVPGWLLACLVLFALGNLPFVQAVKLQQMTLLVLALLAGAILLLAWDRQIPAGILLAAATIKPQAVWLVLFWLAIWTLGDWRRRYRWVVSFLMWMVIFWAASEHYLPHWLFRFWQAAREYHSAGEMSAIAELVGTRLGGAIEIVAFAVVAAACWKARRARADSDAFALIFAMVMATTLLLVPSHGPYNQVMLLPVVLLMLKDRRLIWDGGMVNRSMANGKMLNRVLSLAAAVLLVWPWLSCIVLAGLSFILPPETVERGWALPFWTALQIPLGVAAAMLVYGWQRIFGASQDAATS